MKVKLSKEQIAVLQEAMNTAPYIDKRTVVLCGEISARFAQAERKAARKAREPMLRAAFGNRPEDKSGAVGLPPDPRKIVNESTPLARSFLRDALAEWDVDAPFARPVKWVATTYDGENEWSLVGSDHIIVLFAHHSIAEASRSFIANAINAYKGE